ncbi:unnamed protein product [Auanema sp. JU1783]|nr:unnamed protein product [Auanema sp. JU1783]
MIIPLIPIYLVTLTVGISTACLLTLYFPIWACIPALTTYGKTTWMLKDQSKLVQMIAVPKRWFSHFYQFGVLCTFSAIMLCLSLSYSCYSPPSVLSKYLKMLTPVRAHFDWTTTITTLCLMLFHVYRRFYETLAISVYSDSTMNIAHYLTGLIHYLILPLTVCCESIGLTTLKPGTFDIHTLTYYQWFGILAFFYSNIQQHLIVRTMASLRKTSSGLTSHHNHGLLFGGWFNLVSCPHFFFEVLIYLSLWIVLQGGFAYKFLVFFVILNQMFAALINHRWYQTKFPDKMPPQRKALIPYIL